MNIRGFLQRRFLFLAFFYCPGATAVTINADFVTTFGAASKAVIPLAQEQLDKVLNQNCYNTTQPKGPVPYNCGEYPFGTVINSTHKSLINMNVDKGTLLTEIRNEGRVDGHIYLKDTFNLKVIGTRAQTTTKVKVNLLDQKKPIPFVISPNFAGNLTLRHYPNGGSLHTLACAYMPGIKAHTQTSSFNTSADYTWRWLFLSGTERWSTYTKIDQGSVSLDGAKICASIKTSIKNNLPHIEVTDVAVPTFYNLKLDGLKPYGTQVEIHTFGMQVAQAVLNFFGIINIKATIADTLEKEMQKQLKSQIDVHMAQLENGDIFKKIIEEQFKIKVTKDIIGSFSKHVTNEFDDSVLTYKSEVESVCQNYVSKLLQQNQIVPIANIVQNFCKGLFATVTVSPFNRTATYARAGCYEYNYSPLAYNAVGKNTWWSNGCGIVTKVKIDLEGKNIPSAECLNHITQQLSPTSTTSISVESLAKNGCAATVLAGFLDIPKPLARYFGQVDSLSDITALGKKWGWSQTQINRSITNIKNKLQVY